MDIRRELGDARARTLELALDLDDAQWMGPRLAIVNPMLWELGHVAWFQELWTLRRDRGTPSIRPDADALYDSMRVAHDTRWDLALPDRSATLGYLSAVLARSLLANGDSAPYFHELALFHEDMHGEALTYTRQTLAYREPIFANRASFAERSLAGRAGPLPGDVPVAGTHYFLGGAPSEGFVFDNEKWAHRLYVPSFRIARAPVTNEQYAKFVEGGGYGNRALWSESGWTWRMRAAADHPVYWERQGAEWRVRRYDSLAPLAPHQPVVHVSWYEADAYCRWAGRRLPSEAEWELAASTPEKRRFPWGDRMPSADDSDAAPPGVCNLDGRFGGPVDVAAFPAGDSAYGCRQMIGNVWEWTASDFRPFPGFVADPYAEYSEPWFGSPHKVLRGGCWATRARLLRNTWRNFYPADRRDVLAGFRTCEAAR
jgi:gamma-glutamyl hercynylcysteine S-oxide synthase